MRRHFLRLAVLIPLLVLMVLSANPPVLADEAGDVAALGDNTEAAQQAMAALKAAPAGKLAQLEKGASEFEANLARRFRSRAIQFYREASGTPAQRQWHFLICVAAWDLPVVAPQWLKDEKAAARAKLKAEADPAVIEVMLTTFPIMEFERYFVCRDILTERGAAVIPAATKLLTHPDWLGRARAVSLIANIGGESAMQALTPSVSDPNTFVRRRALLAWVQAGGAWAEKVAAAVTDADASIRCVAVRSLESRANAAATTAKLLADPSFVVRRAAAETLVTQRSEGFEALLAEVSKPGAALAKLEAIRGVGLVAQATAANTLANATDLKGWEARQEAAVGVLEKLITDSDWGVRAAAVEALTLAGRAEVLRKQLDTETHPFVAYRLAQGLGEERKKLPFEKFLPTPTPATPEAPTMDPAQSTLDALRWTADEDKALDDVLKALRITRKDLEFDRNQSTDEFRTPFVQKAINEPLALADMTRVAAQSVRTAAKAAPTSLFAALAVMPQDGVQIGAASTKATDTFDTARKQLQAATNLPNDLRVALLDALAAAPWATELNQAFGNLSIDDRQLIRSHLSELGADEKLLPVWKKVDKNALASAIHHFTHAIGDVASAVGKVNAATIPEGVLFTCDTPFGPIEIGGAGSNRYTGRHFLIIDLGGDDTYLNAASAAALGGEKPNENAFSAVIDVAGNDTYRSSEPVAQGAGFLGVGVLIDLAGHDSYRADAANAQGCGWFGGGLLLDAAGDDHYTSDSVAQGAAGFGFAALVDQAGDDVYYSRAYAQGFGFTGAVGVLAECSGNDLYYIDGKYQQYETMPHRKLSMGQGMGFGMRPAASGGIGMLWDGQGDDVYRGSAFAQGSSYFFAVGMLVDENGFDNYSAMIYSQGSGIHMGIGVFADLSGDDNYTSYGLSQSGSHDMGVSYFLDAAGNDIYVNHGTCGGGAINHAMAIFVDRAGEDSYTMKYSVAFGSGDQPAQKDYPSLGLFLDLGGSRDLYSDPRKADGRMWADGDFGAGLDR